MAKTVNEQLVLTTGLKFGSDNTTKVSQPITRHKLEVFGYLPVSSSAAQGVNPVASGTYVVGMATYNTDGTSNGGTSTWLLSGYFSGTYTLTLFGILQANLGIIKIELSKNNGSSWTTLNAGRDCYSSTAGYWYTNYTGIALTPANTVLVRFTATGKNASSTAYYIYMNMWEIVRTGS